MHKKFIIISLIMITVFTLAGDVFSQHRRNGRGERWRDMPPPPPGFDHMKGMCFGEDEYMRNRLNLGDEQIKTISQINSRFGARLSEYREQLRPLRLELQKLLLSKNIDLLKVRTVLKKISDIELEIRITKIEQRLAIEKTLTPAQHKILDEEKKWMRRRND